MQGSTSCSRVTNIRCILRCENKPIVVICFLLMLLATGFLFTIMPKGFMPVKIRTDSGMTEGSKELI